MIINQVRQFFTGIISEQRIDIYARLIDLFRSRDVHTYIYYIEELISTREQYENQTLVDRFDDIMFEQINELFGQLGVECDPDLKLEEIIVVFEGLMQIEFWEDKAQLAALVEAYDDTIGALCAVLSHITAVPSATLEAWIINVEWSLVENIARLNDDNTSEKEENIMLPEDPVRYERQKAAIKRWMAQHEDNTIVSSVMDAGIRLNRSFETYFDHAINAGLIDFATLPAGFVLGHSDKKLIEAFVDNFVVIGLMADLPREETVQKATDIITGAGISQITGANAIAVLKERATQVSDNE